MEFSRRRKVESLVSIAPLIDCVFLLMIFFLLSSSFIEQAGIEIELPESAFAAPLEKKQIVISLSESGALDVGGEPTLFDDLRTRVAALRERLGTNRALVRADKGVRLELLTKLMDGMKSAGVTSINIQARPAVPASPHHQNSGPWSRTKKQDVPYDR